MPQFSFIAKDRMGNLVKGVVESPELILASNQVGKMGYALEEISESPMQDALESVSNLASPPVFAQTHITVPANSAQSPNALPNSSETKRAPLQSEILLGDAEKRKKVEQDLRKMGMSPEEITRLLNASATTSEAPNSSKSGKPLAKVQSSPLASVKDPGANPKKGRAVVQQKLASKASDLENFAAQLAATNAANRVKQTLEIETVTLELPEFRQSSLIETRASENLLREASLLRRREKFSDAIAKCREALQNTPSDAPALELLGDLYQGIAQTPQALAAYKRATEADPKRASAERKYGDLLMKQQEWSENEDPEAVPSNPVVAAVFSLLYPGAGQLHNGENLKGGIMIASAALCIGAWFLFGTGKEGYAASPSRPTVRATTAAKKTKLVVDWGSEMPLLISRFSYLFLVLGSSADAYRVSKRLFRR